MEEESRIGLPYFPGGRRRNFGVPPRKRDLVDQELDRGGRTSAFIPVGQHRDSPHLGYTDDFASDPRGRGGARFLDFYAGGGLSSQPENQKGPQIVSTPHNVFNPTITFNPTFNPSFNAQNTSSNANTFNPTFNPTNTPTNTFTPTNTNTPTNTFNPAFTPTNTSTPTFTPTFNPVNTPTNTNTPTFTPTFTPTNTSTSNPTFTPTSNFNPTSNPTFNPTNTATGPQTQLAGGDLTGDMANPFTSTVDQTTSPNTENPFSSTNTVTPTTTNEITPTVTPTTTNEVTPTFEITPTTTNEVTPTVTTTPTVTQETQVTPTITTENETNVTPTVTNETENTTENDFLSEFVSEIDNTTENVTQGGDVETGDTGVGGENVIVGEDNVLDDSDVNVGGADDVLIGGDGDDVLTQNPGDIADDFLNGLNEEDPIIQDPVDEDPIIQDPVDEDPIIQDPVDEDPIIQDPVTPWSSDFATLGDARDYVNQYYQTNLKRAAQFDDDPATNFDADYWIDSFQREGGDTKESFNQNVLLSDEYKGTQGLDADNWLSDFYASNNIGGVGGNLDQEARTYWNNELQKAGLQQYQNTGSIDWNTAANQVRNTIEGTARNEGTWNQVPVTNTNTGTSTNLNQYDEFLNRTYNELLGRDVGDEGRNYWGGELASGKSEADVRRGIEGSDEAWLNRQYNELLGRSVGAEGRDYWGGELAGGASRQSVRDNIMASDEYQNLQRRVNLPETPVVSRDRPVTESDIGEGGYVENLVAPSLAYEGTSEELGITPDRTHHTVTVSTDPETGTTSAMRIPIEYPDFESYTRRNREPIQPTKSEEAATTPVSNVVDNFTQQIEQPRAVGIAGDPSPVRAIEDMYQDSLGRTADTEGLNYWTNEVASGNMTLDQVANAIAKSPEAQNRGRTTPPKPVPPSPPVLPRPEPVPPRPEPLPQPRPEPVPQPRPEPVPPRPPSNPIEDMYQTFLGRAADQGGLNYWTNEVASGNMTLDQVANAIAKSPEAMQRKLQPVY